jgi:hypothetical protein
LLCFCLESADRVQCVTGILCCFLLFPCGVVVSLIEASYLVCIVSSNTQYISTVLIF